METRNYIVIQRRDTTQENSPWFDETTDFAETCDLDATKEQVKVNNAVEKDALMPFEYRIVKRTVSDEAIPL